MKKYNLYLIVVMLGSVYYIILTKISRTNVASVGSTFNDTQKVKVLSLPETIKEKSTFRAKALCRELVVGGRGKPHVFLHELIQKHHVTK